MRDNTKRFAWTIPPEESSNIYAYASVSQGLDISASITDPSSECSIFAVKTGEHTHRDWSSQSLCLSEKATAKNLLRGYWNQKTALQSTGLGCKGGTPSSAGTGFFGPSCNRSYCYSLRICNLRSVIPDWFLSALFSYLVIIDASFSLSALVSLVETRQAADIRERGGIFHCKTAGPLLGSRTRVARCGWRTWTPRWMRKLLGVGKYWMSPFGRFIFCVRRIFYSEFEDQVSICETVFETGKCKVEYYFQSQFKFALQIDCWYLKHEMLG